MDAFGQAQTLSLSRRLKVARQTEAGEAVQTAFGKAQAAREAAEQAGAQENCGEAFAALLERVEQGREAAVREEFAEAKQAYEEARQGFVQLQHEAEQQAAEAQVLEQQRQAVADQGEVAHDQQIAPQVNAQDSAEKTDHEYQISPSRVRVPVLGSLVSLGFRYRVGIAAGAAAVILIAVFLSQLEFGESKLPEHLDKDPEIVVPPIPPKPPIPAIPVPSLPPATPYVIMRKTVIWSGPEEWIPAVPTPLAPNAQVFVRGETKDRLILVSPQDSSKVIGYILKDHAQADSSPPRFIPYVITHKTVIWSGPEEWIPAVPTPLAPNAQVFVLNPDGLTPERRAETKDRLILVSLSDLSQEIGYILKDHAQPVEHESVMMIGLSPRCKDNESSAPIKKTAQKMTSPAMSRIMSKWPVSFLFLSCLPFFLVLNPSHRCSHRSHHHCRPPRTPCLSPEEILERVQDMELLLLCKLGYSEVGAIDGEKERDTDIALRKFQRDHELNQNREITNETKIALVQSMLREFSYNPGLLNGQMNPETRMALQQFEKEHPRPAGQSSALRRSASSLCDSLVMAKLVINKPSTEWCSRPDKQCLCQRARESGRPGSAENAG